MDWTQIVTALLTAGVTLAGVLAANNKHAALIDLKIDTLTERVDKHNQVIERTYNLEERVAVLEATRKE